jgi:RimJ/RimL family protein N-acetyltransferase
MRLTRLAPEHAAEYRAFMLHAYAQHADAFTSSAGERALLPLAWWQARLTPAIDADEMLFGALLGTELVGATLVGAVGLSFEKREKARHKATLFGMAVADAAQGRGLGRQLVDMVLDHARARAGVSVVQLTVTEGNHAAEALYRRCGFVPFGVEPMAVKVGDAYVNKVHMWCDLMKPSQPS